jgi:hypothetical protein
VLTAEVRAVLGDVLSAPAPNVDERLFPAHATASSGPWAVLKVPLDTEVAAVGLVVPVEPESYAEVAVFEYCTAELATLTTDGEIANVITSAAEATVFSALNIASRDVALVAV